MRLPESIHFRLSAASAQRTHRHGKGRLARATTPTAAMHRSERCYTTSRSILPNTRLKCLSHIAELYVIFPSIVSELPCWSLLQCFVFTSQAKYNKKE